MAPKTVLITGSSSGFGLSLVHRFLQEGHNVIATSRNPSRTPDLVKDVTDHSSSRGRWLQLDTTWAQPEINATIIEASKLFGPIDILINNAGYSVMGAIEDIDEAKAKVLFETNYWGVFRMCRAVLLSMRERKTGTIVNVSSIGGLQSLPTSGVYSASKFALEALSESLSLEVASFNIRVLIVEPGAFRTNFLGADAMQPHPTSEAYKGTVVETVNKRFKEMEGKQIGDTEKGVQRIYEFVVGEGRTDLLRLPIGSDCYDRATKALREKLENIESLRDVAYSTDFEKGQ
jgi:NAD(P)-dependent dehydrogenase (short-subunit alcohol dehydrogenase family)